MNTELKRFDEAVKSNPKLQEEIKTNVKDNQGLVSFANERGYDFSLDDLNGAAAELSPEDLEKMSGGSNPVPTVNVIVIVLVVGTVTIIP